MMPMELYKKVIHDIPHDIGVLVPVPSTLGRKMKISTGSLRIRLNLKVKVRLEIA